MFRALSGALGDCRVTSRRFATLQTTRRPWRSSPPSAQDCQGAPLDGPRWPPDGLGGLQDAPRGLPRRPREANISAFSLAFEGFWGSRVFGFPTLQDRPEAPKIAPGRPKRPPRRPQDGLRGPQDGPRGAQEGPRRLQDGPRGPQDGPRGPQDGPKRGARRGIRAYFSGPRPQEAPRKPQEAPKRPPGGP